MPSKLDESVTTNAENVLRYINEGKLVDEVEAMVIILIPAKYLGQYKELEKSLVRSAHLLGKYFGFSEITLDGKPWPWHIVQISQGKFPLEKLPEHVRELAKDLYYR